MGMLSIVIIAFLLFFQSEQNKCFEVIKKNNWELFLEAFSNYKNCCKDNPIKFRELKEGMEIKMYSLTVLSSLLNNGERENELIISCRKDDFRIDRLLKIDKDNKLEGWLKLNECTDIYIDENSNQLLIRINGEGEFLFTKLLRKSYEKEVREIVKNESAMCKVKKLKGVAMYGELSKEQVYSTDLIIGGFYCPMRIKGDDSIGEYVDQNGCKWLKFFVPKF